MQKRMFELLLLCSYAKCTGFVRVSATKDFPTTKRACEALQSWSARGGQTKTAAGNFAESCLERSM